MEIYVALAKAGLVAVPINFRLRRRPRSRYIVEHCEARAFIVQDELLRARRVDPLRELDDRRRALDPLRRPASATPAGYRATRR